jgi:hypothetical protein
MSEFAAAIVLSALTVLCVAAIAGLLILGQVRRLGGGDAIFEELTRRRAE